MKMKKITRTILAMLISVFMVFSCVGCNEVIASIVSLFDPFYESNEEKADKAAMQLVECLKNQDNVALKAMFAPNLVGKVSDLDEQIERLFSYFKGEYVSYKIDGAMFTNTKRHEGDVICYHELPLIITTTTTVYRADLEWYCQDDTDVGNEGVWSFYMIEEDDLWYPQYTYWGAGPDEMGIRLNRKPAKNYSVKLIEYMQKKDCEGLKSSLAPNVLVGVEDIDEQIEALLNYYNDYFWSSDGRSFEYEYVEDRSAAGNVCYLKTSCKIKNTAKPGYDSYDLSEKTEGEEGAPSDVEASAQYRVCLLWRIEDTADVGNVGLWSYYIINEEEYTNTEETYWGDGLWTNGFNVGKQTTVL